MDDEITHELLWDENGVYLLSQCAIPGSEQVFKWKTLVNPTQRFRCPIECPSKHLAAIIKDETDDHKTVIRMALDTLRQVGPDAYQEMVASQGPR